MAEHPTVETQLVEFAHHRLTDADAARHMMRLSLFDWAVCARAGRDEPVSQILRDLARADAGRPDASVVGGGQVPPRRAAEVNGTISHALDYDDTHFGHIGHPSVAVIPAALAVAEAIGASLDEMCDAALIGAESSVRVGMWLGRGHYQVGFHQTATAGAFGAALAVGRLMQLDRTTLLHGLGVAATRAAGLKSQFGTMGKPYHAGMAAATGVEAMALARAGFQSTLAGLTDPQGFGPTHHGAEAGDAFAALGTDWEMTRVSHKFHACCHGLHAMIEALLQLGAVSADRVETLEIVTHPRWLSVCNILAPKTGLEAKFSYRMVAAMVLAGHDTARMQSYHEDLADDPELAVWRQKVSVVPDEAMPETASRVTLRGDLEMSVSFDLADPLPLDLRTAKLRAKAASLLGDDAATMLWDAVHQNDLGPLLGILRSR